MLLIVNWLGQVERPFQYHAVCIDFIFISFISSFTILCELLHVEHKYFSNNEGRGADSRYMVSLPVVVLTYRSIACHSNRRSCVLDVAMDTHKCGCSKSSFCLKNCHLVAQWCGDITWMHQRDALPRLSTFLICSHHLSSNHCVLSVLLHSTSTHFCFYYKSFITYSLLVFPSRVFNNSFVTYDDLDNHVNLYFIYLPFI